MADQIFVTSAQLSEICGGSAGSWETEINAAMKKCAISDVNRAAAFLAQCAHETQHFTRFEENLNYSSANRIRTVFSSHYSKSDGLAEQHINNPEGLANHVYKNRNGNREAGDGYKYRGRGLIHLTFRANYFQCSRGIGVDILTNPDSIKEKINAALSAAWFWQTRGCNAAADACDINRVTRIVNGGMNGAYERKVLYEKAIRVLRGEAKTKEPPEKIPTNTTPENVSPTPKPEKNNVGEKPTSTTKSKYPFNKVYESPTGHLIEVDDTPGKERVHIMHRSGSYLEFDFDSDITLKSKRDGIFVFDGDELKTIKGDRTTKISGQSYTKSDGAMVLKSDQKITLDSSAGVVVNAPNLSFSNTMTGGEAKLRGLTVDTPIVGTAMYAMMLGAAPGGFNATEMASSVSYDNDTYTLKTTNLEAKNGIKLGHYRIQVLDVGGAPALLYQDSSGGWSTFGAVSDANVTSLLSMGQGVTPPTPAQVTAMKDPISGSIGLGFIQMEHTTFEGKIVRPWDLPEEEEYWLEGSFRAMADNDTGITSGEANINGDRAVIRNGAIAETGEISFDIVGLDWKVRVNGKLVEGTQEFVEFESTAIQVLEEGDDRIPLRGDVAPGSNPYIPLKKEEIYR